ncbi:T9SS type A sorting domain-containing protein [bacterium]|nr:T9SS type A sorting domain-containing protein [bacterium]
MDFGLPADAAVRLTVFDVNGRAVATLIDGTLPAGWQRVTWDGRDAQGTPVAAGVYLYRLEVGAERIQRKMLIVK